MSFLKQALASETLRQKGGRSFLSESFLITHFKSVSHKARFLEGQSFGFLHVVQPRDPIPGCLPCESESCAYTEGRPYMFVALVFIMSPNLKQPTWVSAGK